MSEVNEFEDDKSQETNIKDNDSKSKFRKALEKKNQINGFRNAGITDGPKVSRGQATGITPKIFRRKSGSA
jgi:hypothetical protein